jgi:hypothetical protein
MKKALSLSIPEPCHENWDKFIPTDTGGFCNACNKNVIDFTHAAEADILNFFKHKPEHACGKFRTSQLKTYYLAPDSIRPGFTLLRAGVLSLLLLLISKPGSTQFAAANVQTERVEEPVQVTGSTVLIASRVPVKGVVTSAEDGSPLPGVSVVVKGTAIGTQTDGEGRFELLVELKQESKLTFSFIGMKTEDFSIDQNSKEIQIAMEVDNVIFGEIIWTGQVSVKEPYTEKPSFFRRTWTKVKNIF